MEQLRSNPTHAVFLVALLCTLLPTGCGSRASGDCDDRIYTEKGLSKEAYVPCAAKILDSMAKLDGFLAQAATGDETGRRESLRMVEEIHDLIKKAGGIDKLRSPWADYNLTRMNAGICNAIEIYDIEAYALAHPIKSLRGQVSKNNVELAKRGADEARMWFRYSR